MTELDGFDMVSHRSILDGRQAQRRERLMISAIFAAFPICAAVAWFAFNSYIRQPVAELAATVEGVKTDVGGLKTTLGVIANKGDANDILTMALDKRLSLLEQQATTARADNLQFQSAAANKLDLLTDGVGKMNTQNAAILATLDAIQRQLDRQDGFSPKLSPHAP